MFSSKSPSINFRPAATITVNSDNHPAFTSTTTASFDTLSDLTDDDIAMELGGFLLETFDFHDDCPENDPLHHLE